ncbi:MULTISPECIES: NAD(P)/FAD-dependent oxidoreductase [Prauserella salsuginis group]|uniref:NAD(P)/FAD-dependent oxidoreductase n=1 Tax=Prauserella salsuginis TaxID=387889 RepID=A0ABW6G0U3_9PSEU|nr:MULTISPECIES: FAD/NAD(P)-binding oxidoreductase [Prauserella salsuginis group]MCR3721975.1 NADPH-dependent 2,4-dienoyl-CoA reductase, sulfur reductase [Prauserella flava]MCR3735981.1 NADPH-dependent 2,4-dienoyl-CoA reductase, sulfur reductase [Prauserella salsuginis]
MSTCSSDVLVVGGSVAATRAAEIVVRKAPQLSVVVVSDESHAPYERPPLSKTDLDDAMDLDALTYPTVATLRDAGVEFELATRAERLDVGTRTVTTTTGSVEYGALVIATGCEPVIPSLLRGLDDVYALRCYEDAVALRAAVAGSDTAVAIVGAGFIGGEFAATLAKQERDVALIDLAPKPLGRFGDAVAASYKQLHRDAGVTLHLGTAAVDVTHDGGRRELVLDDDTRVRADVILLGVGVRPAVDWLADSGLTLDNGIVCDTTLRAADRVYAAGDAIRWTNARFGSTMRIEHWTNAAQQGRVAGMNAANAVLGESPVECANVPYFWSDQHGVRIQFAGHRTGDEEIVESHDDSGSLYLYRRGDEVTGALAFERRTQFVKLRAALKTPLPWETARELAELA